MRRLARRSPFANHRCKQAPPSSRRLNFLGCFRALSIGFVTSVTANERFELRERPLSVCSLYEGDAQSSELDADVFLHLHMKGERYMLSKTRPLLLSNPNRVARDDSTMAKFALAAQKRSAAKFRALSAKIVVATRLQQGRGGSFCC